MNKRQKEIQDRHEIPRKKLRDMGFSKADETEHNKARILFYRCGAVVVILQLWFDGGWDLYIPASTKNNIDSQFEALDKLINGGR